MNQLGELPSELRSQIATRGQRWLRLHRRALRLAAMTFLLPVPLAFGLPQSSFGEHVLASTSVPVTGVGDTLVPRVLALEEAPLDGSGPNGGGPTASLTHMGGGRKDSVPSVSAVTASGIPEAALRAYRSAEATLAIADPACKLSWGLLAGIGRVESDHGRYGGAVLGDDGISTPQILGLPLNGAAGVAAISDTDGGALDGDTSWDRAVGPMQFIPSTWALVGTDADGDGTRNPHDLDDAALAAGAYLCVGERDLSTYAGVREAVFSYNHSQEYVELVLAVANAYESGVVDLPPLLGEQYSAGPEVDVGLGALPSGQPLGGSDTNSGGGGVTSPTPRGGSGDSGSGGDTTGVGNGSDGTTPTPRDGGGGGGSGGGGGNDGGGGGGNGGGGTTTATPRDHDDKDDGKSDPKPTVPPSETPTETPSPEAVQASGTLIADGGCGTTLCFVSVDPAFDVDASHLTEETADYDGDGDAEPFAEGWELTVMIEDGYISEVLTPVPQ